MRLYSLALRAPRTDDSTARRMAAITAAALFVSLGACVLPAITTAQADQGALAPGARVRVSGPRWGSPFEGRVTALSGDTLSVRMDGLNPVPIQVLLDDRTSVQVNVARRNKVGAGFVAGGLAGLGIGGIVVMARNESPTWFPTSQNQKHVSYAPMPIGLAIGSVVGLALGAVMVEDTWVPARLPGPASISLGVSGSANGGVRLAVSISR